MLFKEWMNQQYHFDEQFDMDLEYTQLDMEAAFNAGADIWRRVHDEFYKENKELKRLLRSQD